MCLLIELQPWRCGIGVFIGRTSTVEAWYWCVYWQNFNRGGVVLVCLLVELQPWRCGIGVFIDRTSTVEVWYWCVY